MLTKGSTNVKKDAFFDYLVLGGSGRVREKAPKVRRRRGRPRGQASRMNLENKAKGKRLC
jgi:hypothetical protein